MKLFFWALAFIAASSVGARAQTDAPIYLTGGHLVDVIRGEIYEDIGVLIEGDKITGLFFDFGYNADRIPDDAVYIDLSGKYLIPGLIDLHAHAYTHIGSAKVDLQHFFKMFLAGGVTTVRSMSPNIREMIRAKLEIDAGRADGPSIFTGSSPAMEQAPGFPKLVRTTIVNNPIEARSLVREHALNGADWIKFYNYGDAAVVEAVVDEAHKHGRKVFGHFATLGAAEASRLGVDSLEHTVSLLQKSLSYEDSISLTDIGYYRLFALWPKVNEEKLDEIFEVLVENGTAVIPTLAVQAVVAEPEEMNRRSAEWFDLYQKSVREEFFQDTNRVPAVYNFSAVLDDWGEAIEVQARQMARFVNMGGKVGAGSDLISAPPLVPGLSIHQELEYFVDGGMTPLQALRTATITAAEILGWPEQFGSIEIGKQADIVAIEGNPLADIRSVYNIHTVIQSGRVHPIEELKDELRLAAEGS